MIEATCTACGNINHVAEADIPVGVRFVNCSNCKARVAIPTKTTLGGAPIKPPAAGDAFNLSDLPAPKRSTALGVETSKPPPRSGLAAALDADLPAPRSGARPAVAAPLEPLADRFADDDLMPVGVSLGADLPAPKTVRGVSAARAATPESSVSDLPTPKPPRTSAELASKLDTADLPAPKPRSLTDLPTPAQRPPPIPKPGPPPELVDLPAPRASGIIDLPAPRASGPLELPVPARKDVEGSATGELPAPKGFFDDLPQPASPAQSRPDLPAPKGFFDDLPGKPNPNKPAKPELPAPKGFFEDLPGRVNPNKPVAAEPPAPKGFFDDIPGRVNASKPEPAKGFFDDLPQPSKKPSDPPKRQAATHHVPISSNSSGSIDLDATDLGPPIGSVERKPEVSARSKFDNLDLSKPTSGPIRITPPKQSPQHNTETLAALRPSAQFPLELEEPRAPASQPLAPKRTQTVPDKPARKPRRRVLALAALFVVALGAGGFAMYRRFASKPAASINLAEELAAAHAAMAESDAAHWDRAASAARKVLSQDKKNADALAVAAEALLASGLANGIDQATKFGQARAFIATAVGANVAGPGLIRAQALSAIAAGTADLAIERLQPLFAQDPKNAALFLYVGWAQAVRGDPGAAIPAFDQAVGIGSDALKLYALYGRAQAKLAQGNLAGAHGDFDAVYQLDKNLISAQVGLAASLPIAKAQNQEAELRAILERKDLGAADPRAVVQAWLLIAETAKRGSRFDVARERYRSALAIAPDNLRALSGLAEVELVAGKLDAATELVKKALEISKDDLGAQLVQAEISIQQNDLRDAAARVDALVARSPTPPVADQARIKLLVGKLLDANGDDDAAVKAYEEAAKLAGETDLAPTLAAVKKLTALAKASRVGESAKATEFRRRADELLGALAKNAESDPQLALTLGIAYLQVQDPTKAETWLRGVVESRPKEAEGYYQLAKALALLNKTEDAVSRLQQAMVLSPGRAEIGIELALTYETAGRDAEALATYTKLLAAAKDPSVEVRARAGRFFARVGEITKAAAQGDKILETEPTHTTGMYLKAEGLLATDHLEDARALFTKATATEREPQFLDGLGRVDEELARKTGDTRIQDAAIRAYLETIELAPTMWNPRAGLGRLYMARREFSKAVAALVTAYGLRRDAEVAFQLGIAYKELQQVPAAIEWLNESLKHKPNAEASWYLGEMYFDSNQGNLAAGALESATRTALESEKKTGVTVPWLTEALHKLGRLYKDLNNLHAAREAWEKYVGRNPPPSVQLTEVRRALATSLRGQ